MKCPHCDAEIDIPVRAEYNAHAYGKPVIVSTLCCGKGVRILPRRVYDLEAVDGEGEDDWGVSFK